MTSSADDRWLVALDIDGTILSDYRGNLNPWTIREVARLVDEGHEVTIATGRSVPATLPVLAQLNLTPQFVVCANGAIILHRDESEESGYRRGDIETFNPNRVLETIHEKLPTAHYAVEDVSGLLKYLGWFPEAGLDVFTEEVQSLEALMTEEATRVVVISPTDQESEFQESIASLGLHQVSYSIGYTSWLEIGPFGVNKATALEKVRESHGIDRARVMAVGDGRNDIQMLAWAAEFGRGVAMGQAPDEVRSVANEVTHAAADGGLPAVLATLSANA